MAVKSFIGTTNTTWNNAASWSNGTLPVNGDTIHPNGAIVNFDADFNQPLSVLTNASGTSDAGGAIASNGQFRFTTNNVSVTALSAQSVTSSAILLFNAGATGVTISIATITGSTTSTAGYGLYIVTVADGGLTLSGCTFAGSAIGGGNAVMILVGCTIVFINCTAIGGSVASSDAFVVGNNGSLTASGTLSCIQGASSVGRAISTSGSGAINGALSGNVTHQNASTTIGISAGTLQYTMTSEVITGILIAQGVGLFYLTGAASLTLIRPAGSLQMHSATGGPHYLQKGSAGSNITMIGDVTCGTGSGAYVAYDSVAGSGSITINGTVTGPISTSNNSGLITVASGKLSVRHIARNPTSGQRPSESGLICYYDDTTITATTSTGTVTLVPSGSVGDPPAQTDVRDGVAYHFDTLEGSLIVPSPSYVSTGVATDNTVGTLVAGMTPLELREALFHADDTANKLRVSAAGAVELDSTTATQIDTIEAAVTTLGSDSTTVERSVSDTNAITFSWPVSGASITGTASLNNGSYGAVAGAIAFLRTETGRHYYTLAYNVADRTAAEGQVRYKFVDGTYTGYVVLRTVNLVTTAQVNAQVLDVLSVDTFAELAAPPAATSSLKDKITWLFMYARNKVTQTALERKLYRDDTTTVAGTSATSDNGTTFTKGEDS